MIISLNIFKTLIMKNLKIKLGLFSLLAILAAVRRFRGTDAG